MSYFAPITSSSANTPFQGSRSEPNRESKTRICSFLFASIWAATAGAAMAQALNPHASWPVAMTLPLPILSLLIPDCSANDRSLKERVSSCARSIFTFWGVGLLITFGLGVASSVAAMSYAFPRPSNSTNLAHLMSQWGLLGIHFLSAYAKSVYLKKNTESHEPEDEIEEVNPDVGNANQEDRELVSQIADLEERNAEMEEAFKKLKILIKSDTELKELFESCYQATRHIVLPPSELRSSPPVDDPIIEEWGKQSKLNIYYRGLIDSLQSFLEINPEFLALLQTKIDQKEIAFLTGESIC